MENKNKSQQGLATVSDVGRFVQKESYQMILQTYNISQRVLYSFLW